MKLKLRESIKFRPVGIHQNLSHFIAKWIVTFTQNRKWANNTLPYTYSKCIYISTYQETQVTSYLYVKSRSLHKYAAFILFSSGLALSLKNVRFSHLTVIVLWQNASKFLQKTFKMSENIILHNISKNYDEIFGVSTINFGQKITLISKIWWCYGEDCTT